MNPFIETLHTNGRLIKRISLSRALCLALGCTLESYITRSKCTLTRRGSGTLHRNCVTGIAGQIATMLWLRYIGLPAYMLPFESAPDGGFDIVIGSNGEFLLRIEVKTSYFADGRGAELLRCGDRMPKMRRFSEIVNFMFWLVVSPEFFSQTNGVTFVDLIATVPAGVLNFRPRVFSAVPGMRMADIDPRFNARWFARAFDGARGDAAPYDTFLHCGPSDTINFGDIVSHSAVKNLFYGDSAQVITEIDIFEDAKRRYESALGSKVGHACASGS